MIMNRVKVVGSGNAGLFARLISWLWKYRKWSITMFLVVFILFGAIQDSVEEKSVKPLLDGFALRVLSADTVLYHETLALKNSPDQVFYQVKDDGFFWEKLKFYSSVVKFYVKPLANFWFIYIIWYLFFMIVRKTEQTDVQAGIWAFVILWLVMLCGNNYVLLSGDSFDNSLDLDTGGNEVLYTFIPFRGVITFFTNLNLYLPDLSGVGFDAGDRIDNFNNVSSAGDVAKVIVL